jgi:predicted TPR repeat methyltransferase
MTTSAAGPVQEIDVTPEQAIEIAIRAIRSGKLDAGERLLGQILEEFPEHPHALHFYGLVQAQRGKPQEAIALVKRSLTVMPGNAGAWNNLGNLYVEQQDVDGAIDAYRACLDIAPEFPEALNNIGTLMRARGDLDGAERHYRQALAIRPAFSEAINNLGTIQSLRGNYEVAADLFREAITLEPNFGDAYTNLGETFHRMGKAQDAAQCLWKSIAVNGSDRVARRILIYALLALGKRTEAIAVAREWIEDCPNDPDARHHLAAATGENVPDRCPDDYVVAVFDRFANSFDQVLTNLEYKAPDYVAALLAQDRGAPKGDLVILDAGCGTGLCGPLLRPYARQLDGIDLSKGMIDKATARGGYDRLEVAEITAAMAGAPSTYDAVISADTLCYFGDLAAVIAAAASTLKPDGTLIFSVEAIESPEEDGYAAGFRINAGNGRYAHARHHVEAVAAAAGLTITAVERKQLRVEGAVPVIGDIYAMRKPS